jgi:teichuronic acid biosynthesis glycosyltransferase TuaC
MSERQPRLVVFSTLFPHPGQPHAGVFIRERMFRVGRVLPLVVVAPIPWFPFQGLIRLFRSHFRPVAPYHEVQQGFDVYHPRFFSVPGLFKVWDGFFMALSSYRLMVRLKRSVAFNIIDAHFAYPDGYAATLLGKWLEVPVTVTLRGTEVPLSRFTGRRRRIVRALQDAARVFSVSASLKKHAVSLGIHADKIRVVGNGVDTNIFHPRLKAEARNSLGLPGDVPLMISIGALVERKGFHRVIECLPHLRDKYPGLRYLIVGGAGPEGDMTKQLQQQVKDMRLEDCVMFLGKLLPEQLRIPLSAADVFVLSTRNEGWANVFLEAMACGLPVVTTNVGGNAEVINSPELGAIVPFDEKELLCRAIMDALRAKWDRQAIIAYARANSWDDRVKILEDEFKRIAEIGNLYHPKLSYH